LPERAARREVQALKPPFGLQIFSAKYQNFVGSAVPAKGQLTTCHAPVNTRNNN
jgi:hypothetical protein